MKIVILDGYSANPGDLSWKSLMKIGELTVYDRTRPEETVERAKDADIVLTNKVCLHRQEIDQLPQLKYIGVLATGYNVVDVDAANEHGIVVTNVPAYSTMSVAQMVFAHLLTVTNRTEHYAMQNREGRWAASPDFCYWDTDLTELAGKTMGIVGLGNIGSRVAEIADAFGMNVVALTSKEASEIPFYVEKRTLTELLKESDVVSLHCPLDAGTRYMINRQTLRSMKPSAILVNTGRGPLVNEQDVADALRENRLRAYCADVLSEEPPRAECLADGCLQNKNPLLECEHAFITPHIAWATKEARMRLIEVAINNVKAFVDNRPQNVVS
jgi:glycerate dehydrogenase